MHSRFVPAAGVRLHLLESGSGEPLLMLHGFPDRAQVWAQVMQRLAGDFHTLAPDQRGYNLSEKPKGVAAYHIDRLVDDVCTLIDTQASGRCALVGHDWGGMLAWTVAARHPQRVAKLAVLNAPHPCLFAQALRDDPAQRAASSYVHRLCAPQAESLLAANDFQALWNVVAGCFTDAPAERMAAVQAWSQPGALTAMLNWYRALHIERALAPPGVAAVPELGGASGRIEAPTLLLWGDDDASFAPSCLLGLEHWVPRLQLVHVATGSHWLQLQQADFVAERLREFLQNQS